MKKFTEEELKEEKVFWPKSFEELNKYIDSLINGQHDYGTCVYAMSLASLATFNFIASKLGVTGFQASCADLDFIKRNRGYKNGFQIIDYNKLLYPQYNTEEHFPTRTQLIKDNLIDLKKSAIKLLHDSPNAAKAVKDHWQMIIDL